jgi:LPS export ABC transporter permease LptF
MRSSWTISKYLTWAVLPYFIFSWLLLSVILFVQQASRFYDIFFSVNIPANLVSQLTLALIPNVIAFTCPMAVLVGVIIGLSRMQGDSELVAIRAAGVGNFQITLPVVVLGIVLSLFAFFVNLYGVPLAAGIVRRVAMQTAIYKLESPIEPGVFNTEVAGYTIYVKDGDLTAGQWKNIFIYNEDEKSGTMRLITSSNGRIDSSNEQSELVLENAVSSTFTKTDGQSDKYVSEKIGEIRFAIKTRRGELIEKLSSQELTPEELGLAQLSEFAGKKEGKERTEAQILWQRRIILSLSPLIFCVLGTSMVLRFARRGRGFGIFLALMSLITYYLFAFLGEQLARTGRISVFVGSLIPITASIVAILWFNYSGKLRFVSTAADHLREQMAGIKWNGKRVGRTSVFMDLTTGLRDFDLLLNLAKYYFLTLGFLAVVFVIFTAFELWKFAGTIDGGIVLLVKYLFFLLPFIYIQLAPSAAMIAILATYVIKSRQNEIVTWTAAGQSVYRILLPCVLAMIALGFVNWQIQERIAPGANQIQDELRSQIRSQGLLTNKSGKYWVANDKRIYSFELSDGSKGRTNNTPASDNEKRSTSSCPSPCTVKNLTVYEFGSVGDRLQAVYRSPSAIWDFDKIRFVGDATKVELADGSSATVSVNDGELDEESNPFAEMRKKPSHLNSTETRQQINHSESDIERRSFTVALEKKYTTLLLPFIISLFTAPFALSLSRKGRVITVGMAVGLWLIFMGVTNVFEQFGLNGQLPSGVAVWAPLVIFATLGVYLLSKVKT